MFFSKKGQGSIEIIFGIFFLILFLYIFNILAQDTVNTIEVNKIKEDEQEIILSLSDFLYSGANIYDDNKFNIIDLNMVYNVPQINIPSSRVSCSIVVTDFRLSIITEYNDENIIYFVSSIVPDTFVLPINTSCGNQLSCITDSGKIRCT